jgi:hypothetical protein
MATACELFNVATGCLKTDLKARRFRRFFAAFPRKIALRQRFNSAYNGS